MNRCRTFCRKTYLPTLKRAAYKYDRYYLPIHSMSGDKNFGYKTCVQGFCNPRCTGYTSKPQERKWQKSRKKGFHSSYTKEQIDKYKKQGALSGCIEHHNMYNL